MIAINIDGKIRTFSDYPETWNNTTPYQFADEETKYEDGFRDVVEPQLTATQRRGELIYDAVNDVFTYEKIERTTAELQQEKINNSQSQRANLIQEIQEKKVIAEMQAVTDETKLLEVAALFPVWEVGMALKVGEKVQGFLNKELVLFRVIQAHTTQADWKPESTPALFVRVGFADEILDWVQPTGGHDAYKIGDRVKFGGDTWESLINGNTWSPTAYPQGWKKL